MARLTLQRGLITSNSEVARADGSAVVLDNCVIDFQNIIQQRRGLREYSQLLPAAAKQTLSYKNRIIAHYATTLAFDNGSGLFSSFTGSYEELITGLRIKALEANGNFYFTTKEGVKKISVKNASDLTTSTPIINAGAAKAIDLTGKVIPDSSGFLPAQSKVAYRVLFGYKDANSNVLLGVPSARTILTNYSNDVSASEIFTVNFLNFAAVTNGDYFTFYTASGGYYVWYNKTGAGTAPVNADTLDKTGIEVDIQGAANVTDLAAYTANAISTANTEVTIEITGPEVEVTVIAPGDVSDPDQGSFAPADVAVTKVFDGSITTGVPALCELSFTLPQEVDTTYFYQLYRTGVTTVTAGVTLNDIDPGDEGQLVFEAPISAADVTAGEIIVQDNTPETFRASGAYIYTSANNGQGIAQANERPPIAQDLSTFRGSTFYANTKEAHKFQFSILSVDDFVSGSTKFYIGRGADAVEYTFVGVNEVFDLTVDTTTNTVENSYVLLNSANDERMYYLWFDKGVAPVDPALSGKTGIRVPLELYPDTLAGTKQAIIESLFTISDFSAEDFSASVVRISCTDSGSVTDPSLSTTPAPGGAWAVSVVTQGDGEDVIAKEVLLSTSASVGVAIDQTARSLQRVINKDPDSPVTALYLSGVDDLPGKLLLEAKNLEDEEFYVAISDISLASEFSPELPENYTINSVTSNVFETLTPHNFAIGDEIYVNTFSAVTGNFIVATVPTTTSFTLTGVTTPDNAGPLSGLSYLTTGASTNNETPNRIMYSKASQPEAVPSVNYIDVGSKDKAIFRILALRDNLFVLKEDGIFIVTGASAPNFSVRLIDNSAIVTAPDTAVVLNNLIYCLSTQGVISISDSGVSIVSRDIEDQIKKVTTFAYNFKFPSFGVSYESDRAYILWLPTAKADTVATQCFRYSTITGAWTRWTVPATCGIVTTLGDDRLYIGKADRNYIAQERKNGEREDYADRDFTLSIGADSVSGDRVTLNSVVNVEVGDVFVQEQYLDVPKYNRLLRKLDKDTGPADNDYYSTLNIAAGASLGNALLSLVAKLNADANLAGTFTTPSGSNTSTDVRDDHNLLISELNDVSSGTSLKDYKTATDLLKYEVLITDMTKGSNTVTVSRETWLVQDVVQLYKAIKSEVQWSPQTFGEPEKFKQVSDGTLIFDQGTIYGGIIAYSSDRSADFVEIEFELDGPGFWAHMDWYDVPFGGSSNDVPVRTLVPQNKSRCRYLNVKMKHFNAREQYKLLGISLEVREYSARAYR